MSELAFRFTVPLAVTVLVVGACAASPPHESTILATQPTAPPPEDPFEAFLPRFMTAWDVADRSRLEQWVEPRWGLWLILRRIGMFPAPERRKPHYLATLEDGPGERLRGVSFGCQPHRDAAPPAPDVATCEQSTPAPLACGFGAATLDLGALDEAMPKTGIGPPEIPARRRRPGDPLEYGSALTEAGRAVSHFIVDAKIGAVFYFGHTAAGWRIIAVDLSTCPTETSPREAE